MKYDKILKAPKEYWELTSEQKKEICNGVGPKGLGWLFPETVWGCRVTEAADIHDYEYHIGITISDKKKADINFLDNMKLIIRDPRNIQWKWLVKRRLFRAEIMYEAVHLGGMAAFLNKK